MTEETQATPEKIIADLEMKIVSLRIEVAKLEEYGKDQAAEINPLYEELEANQETIKQLQATITTLEQRLANSPQSEATPKTSTEQQFAIIDLDQLAMETKQRFRPNRGQLSSMLQTLEPYTGEVEPIPPKAGKGYRTATHFRQTLMRPRPLNVDNGRARILTEVKQAYGIPSDITGVALKEALDKIYEKIDLTTLVCLAIIVESKHNSMFIDDLITGLTAEPNSQGYKTSFTYSPEQIKTALKDLLKAVKTKNHQPLIARNNTSGTQSTTVLRQITAHLKKARIGNFGILSSVHAACKDQGADYQKLMAMLDRKSVV